MSPKALHTNGHPTNLQSRCATVERIFTQKICRLPITANNKAMPHSSRFFGFVSLPPETRSKTTSNFQIDEFRLI